ncbi:MAG: dihydroneopterin aldolase [Nitrosomonadales bacterium]|jgi:dihydroneopterin aldolase|nr:dihydroneopterin aldolase [Nitrosomonadales bacterium]MBT5572794.1 dihydroneopterin aldolase [Nitrosomonadales bacterium]MBT6817865.1 dihydroneopterin aldolase [Nitrosomonadales bacterium]MBT7121269.1 dihydroneopterin aldolase [Nitrosomonadales bacterium]
MANHIFLHKLKVNTKIGYFEWERATEQELLIDIDIELKGNQIFNSDDISKTLDYGEVRNSIASVAETHKFHLLEPFGELIIKTLKENFPFEKITLRIAKQKILSDTDQVGIILER